MKIQKRPLPITREELYRNGGITLPPPARPAISSRVRFFCAMNFERLRKSETFFVFAFLLLTSIAGFGLGPLVHLIEPPLVSFLTATRHLFFH